MRRIVIILVASAGVAGSAGAQRIDLMSLEFAGRAELTRTVFDRRTSADTTAYIRYQRAGPGGELQLMRVDVNAGGQCYIARPDERGLPCRGFDHAESSYEYILTE